MIKYIFTSMSMTTFDLEQRDEFRAKCFLSRTSMSELLNKWIGLYLAGELE